MISIRWNSIQSFEYVEKMHSIRLSFLVPQSLDSDFLLPYLSNQQPLLTIRFCFTPEVFTTIPKTMEMYTKKLQCSIQGSSAKAPVSGECSLSQPTKGCRSSVIALSEYNQSTPQPSEQSSKLKEENTRQKTSTAISFVPETQDPSSPSTPSISPETPVEYLFPDEPHTPPPSTPIDVLGSLHTTPIRPIAKQKEEEEKKKEEKEENRKNISEGKKMTSSNLTTSKTTKTTKTTQGKESDIQSKLAGLSRRKGMTFLSQLTNPAKKEVVMESGYTRKWNLPRKTPIEMDEESDGLSNINSTSNTKIEEKKEEKRKENQTEEEKKKGIPKRQKKKIEKPKTTKSTKTIAEKEIHIDEEKQSLGEKRTTTTTTTSQTTGRKRIHLSEKLIKMKKEEDPIPLVDQFKTILSTPKYKLPDSVSSSPLSNDSNDDNSSNNKANTIPESESEDDDPSILAFQQAVTCTKKLLLIFMSSYANTTKEREGETDSTD